MGQQSLGQESTHIRRKIQVSATSPSPYTTSTAAISSSRSISKMATAVWCLTDPTVAATASDLGKKESEVIREVWKGVWGARGDGSAECGWWRTARSPSGWKRRRRTTPPAARKTLASAPQTACLASSASRTARGLGTHGLAWSSRGHNNRARHDCFQNEGINISLARTHAGTPRCNDKYSPLFQEIRMAI